MKQYSKVNIPLARELRRNMTPWERKLWYEYLRYYPVRFQRQKAIGKFIADFYCAKAGLIVELDGGGHCQQDQMNADANRTEILKNMNLRVLRVCNLDVDKNFRGVCEKIDMEVQRSLPQSASLTAPSSEGALACDTKGKTIYTLGFFDGVHVGHQALLSACVRLARERNMETAAITFSRHPQALFVEEPPRLISTPEDRKLLLRHFGMQRVDELPVTKEVMSTNWECFLEQLIQRGAAGFVCGNDFRFGHKGQGDAEKLRQFCKDRAFPCVIVPEQSLDGVRVSSTRIRQLLETGDMERAVRFLGHPHILTGTVVPGKQLGRTLGVPTANLALPEGLVVPKFGVYACRVLTDGQSYPAVTNIGSRPTVNGEGITVEPWLLGFDGDLYGKELTLEFHKFLRPEQKFPSLEALKQQISRDADQVKMLDL